MYVYEGQATMYVVCRGQWRTSSEKAGQSTDAPASHGRSVDTILLSERLLGVVRRESNNSLLVFRVLRISPCEGRELFLGESGLYVP